MNKCCCNSSDVKFFQRPNAGICDQCHPAENKLSPLEAVAMCPPIGEPRFLTMMAPAVFDEIGLNLCRTVCLNELEDVCRCNSNDYTDIIFDGISKEDLAEADKIQLQVVDINFNFDQNSCCERYSEIKSAKGNPNLSRITLKDIDVTLAVSCISECCKVTKTGMMTLRYLGDEESCGHDSCTNPSAVTFDLYTPYGVGYKNQDPDGCYKLVRTINYMGFVGENQNVNSCRENVAFDINNTIQQGVSAQALAKVIARNDDCFAIGLTLYVKAIYFVQYKFKHEGLTVPPKLTPVDESSNNSCLDFVCGDLLEASIQPLEVGKNAKTLGNTTNNSNQCGCGTSN